MNSVNIRNAPCNPSGRFEDCVNMEIQNQGCGNGLLATVACPGILCKKAQVLYDFMNAAGLIFQQTVQESQFDCFQTRKAQLVVSLRFVLKKV